mmetsp:Transcript_101793/g.288262  ORF Transcript_101793/g.288262 Transcript_101793/m.288262 type:complete len:293 (-) Transcript_101793:161-1039(-)
MNVGWLRWGRSLSSAFRNRAVNAPASIPRGGVTSERLSSAPSTFPAYSMCMWKSPMFACGGSTRGVLTSTPALAPWPRCVPGVAGIEAHSGFAGTGIWGISRRFTTRNLRGRLFYKRRPKMIPRWKFNRRSKWLEGVGCRKGVCTKVYVTNAKKPNSGLRKVAMARLSNGRIVKTAIPGIGHNLQVHSVVMVRGGRKKDIVGVNYTCMRGHYDLLPVKNRKSSRSKYGVARPKITPKHERYKHLEIPRDRRLHYYRTGEEIPADEMVPRSTQYPVGGLPPFTYDMRRKRKSK